MKKIKKILQFLLQKFEKYWKFIAKIRKKLLNCVKYQKHLTQQYLNKIIFLIEKIEKILKILLQKFKKILKIYGKNLK